MISPKLGLAGAAALAGVGLALVGQPDVDDHLRWRAAELDATLEARTVHLDPAEVNTLLHEAGTAVQVIDVREEADFNLFHLVDSRRVDLSALRDPSVRGRLDPKALKVFVANGEARAEQAWRIVSAAGIRDAYVLAGGITTWLAIYRDGRVQAPAQPPEPAQVEAARASFEAALGHRYPFARPKVATAADRAFEEKAKRLTKVAQPAGGCGG